MDYSSLGHMLRQTMLISSLVSLGYIFFEIFCLKYIYKKEVKIRGLSRSN